MLWLWCSTTTTKLNERFAHTRGSRRGVLVSESKIVKSPWGDNLWAIVQVGVQKQTWRRMLFVYSGESEGSLCSSASKAASFVQPASQQSTATMAARIHETKEQNEAVKKVCQP
jgi:hypothetical protein